MNVIFTSFYEEAAAGGEARVAFELADAFARTHNTLLVVPGKTNRLEKEPSGLHKLYLKSWGEKGLLFPVLDYTNLKYLYKNLAAFAPSVIHAQSPDIISFMVQIWANNHAIPFLLTSHALPTKRSEFGANESSSYLGKLLDLDITKNFFHTFANNCDALIALNEAAKKDIVKFGYTGKIFVIPNGRNLAQFHNLAIARIQDPVKKLIFVGTISDRKNQLFLLKVMKLLPKNYQLTLIGDVLNKKYKKSLDTFVRQNHLSNVTFTGLVEPSRIADFLEKAHVFVSASKMEVQSLSVIEALASGKPVIGLSNETTDELVDAQVGIRLKKSALPKEFAEKIMEICSLPQNLYEKKCSSARNRVAGLDWTNIVGKTVTVYDQVIGFKQKNKGPINSRATYDSLIDSDSGAFFRSDMKKWKFPLNKSQRKAIYQKLKTWGEKTKSQYLYLPGIFLVAFTLGATYGFMSSISKIRKRKPKTIQ